MKLTAEQVKYLCIGLFVMLSILYLFISSKNRNERYADESIIDQICKNTSYQLDCNKQEDLTKAVDICNLQRKSYAGCQTTDQEILEQACPIKCDSTLSTFSKEDPTMYEYYSASRGSPDSPASPASPNSRASPTIITNTLNLNEQAILQSSNPFIQDTYASNPIISITKSNRGI
jgi:hypothetical protein